MEKEQKPSGSLPAHSVHMRLPALYSFLKLAIEMGWDDDDLERVVKQMGQMTFMNNGEPLTRERISEILDDVMESKANKRRKAFTVIEGGEGLDTTDK